MGVGICCVRCVHTYIRTTYTHAYAHVHTRSHGVRRLGGVRQLKEGVRKSSAIMSELSLRKENGGGGGGGPALPPVFNKAAKAISNTSSLTWELGVHVDIIRSQVLSVAVTAFVEWLDIVLLRTDPHSATIALDAMCMIGFLIGVESLLSTQGNEEGTFECVGW